MGDPDHDFRCVWHRCEREAIVGYRVCAEHFFGGKPPEPEPWLARERENAAAAERARCIAELKAHADGQRRVANEKRADAPCSAEAHDEFADALDRAALFLESRIPVERGEHVADAKEGT